MKIEFIKYPFTPILGWSSSRYDMFKNCKRQYFYNYYPKYVPNVPMSKVKWLKELTTVPLEVGNVVHHILEAFLRRLQKSSTAIDTEKFIQFGYDKCDELFDSKTFLEIYFGYVEQIDKDEAKQKIYVALNNFVTSPIYEWIMSEAVKSTDEWVIEPAGFGETRIAGYKAYCKMDFLLPVDDTIHILDWKSGKRHEYKHRQQLLGYALATQLMAPEISGNKIIPRIVYLYPTLDELNFPITNGAIQNFEESVISQTKEMYEYCKDVEQNIPHNFEIFDKTEYKGICKYCPFQGLCKES